MIDISDGLSSEVAPFVQVQRGRDATFMKTKSHLDPQMISTCEEFNVDSTTIAINGGEDYELLFTIDQGDFDKIKGNPNLTVIGFIKESSAGAHLITRSDTRIPIEAKGWKVFNA